MGVCRTHFARNLLAAAPKSAAEIVVAAYRTVFAHPDPASITTAWDTVAATPGHQHPKITAMMDSAREDVLAYATFPPAHWRKIWSTNPPERLNREVKRRTDVVGVFPKPPALLRLAGAVLIESHDEWAAGERRYFSEASMAALNGNNITALPPTGPTPLDTTAAMTA